MEKYIFLPGTNRQLKFLFRNNISAENVLAAGSNSEIIAAELKSVLKAKVILIVDDNFSLLSSRFALKDDKEISVRMMDYDNTDFTNSKFDLIFSQASVTTKKRDKILKEFKNILKPGGYLCIGEITTLKTPLPPFVKNMLDQSLLFPKEHDELNEYYESKGFSVIAEEDLSSTLKSFYGEAVKKIENEIASAPKDEVEANRKLLKKLTHEAKVYLELGGKDYIGFKTFLLRKD